jgi:hypothetical protein
MQRKYGRRRPTALEKILVLEEHGPHGPHGASWDAWGRRSRCCRCSWPFRRDIASALIRLSLHPTNATSVLSLVAHAAAMRQEWQRGAIESQLARANAPGTRRPAAVSDQDNVRILAQQTYYRTETHPWYSGPHRTR